jgi:hypothetical protein
MRVQLKGITNDLFADPDHHVKFLLNGTDISFENGLAKDAIWDGQNSYLWTSPPFDISALQEGENSLTLQKVNDLRNGEGRLVENQDAYLNYFDIEFKAEYAAQQGRLNFSNSFSDSLGWKRFSIKGLSEPAITVWDERGRKLAGLRTQREGATWTAVFEDSLQGPTRFMAAEESALTPPRLLLDTLPELFSPAEGADYLLITHEDLRGKALDSLEVFHRSRGLRVKRIYVRHIMQDFRQRVAVGGVDRRTAPLGLEDVGHSVWIETGRGQERHAHAICFVLVRARDVDLLLNGRALRHGDASHGRVAGPRGRTDENGRQNGGDRGDALAPLGANAPSNVTLGDMGDFMRQHPGELRFVAGGQNQAVVDSNESTGQRKGVDGVLAHKEERKAAHRLAAGLGDNP